MTFVRTARELMRELRAIKTRMVAAGQDSELVRLLRDGAGWRVETGEGEGASVAVGLNSNCADAASLLLGRALRLEEGKRHQFE